jgi:hypothetical protein
MKNSRHKINQVLPIILSLLLLAGLVLIFKLEKPEILPFGDYDDQSLFTSLPKKTDFLPSPSLEGKPRFTNPPPEVTHRNNLKPSNIPSLTTTPTPTPIVRENGW